MVVRLSHAESTRERELRDIVLVERADVLVVGLLKGGLRLRDGEIVRDAGTEALLRLAEGFGGEIDVGAGGIDEPGRGLDIEDVGADVGVDLLRGVGEAGFGLGAGGGGDLLLAAETIDLEDGRGDLAGGCEGSVGVTGGVADVAEVSVDADYGVLIGAGGFLLRFGGLDLFEVGLEILAGPERGGEGGVGIEVVERLVGLGITDPVLLVERQADGAGERDLVFGKLIAGGDEGLLLALVIDLGAQDVEARAGSGVMRGDGLVEGELGGFQSGVDGLDAGAVRYAD